MITQRTSTLRVIFQLIVLLLAGTSVQAQTSITKLPYTISKPGSYALRKSLVYGFKSTSPLAAITINSDDVKIDLLGNDISIDREISRLNETAGIFANGRKNITIRNGVLKNFFRGIYLEGSNLTGGHLVEQIEAADSTFLGIQVKGRGSVIRNNFVNVVGRDGGATSYVLLRYGMDILGSGVVVSDNRVFDITLNSNSPNNNAYGIYVHDSDSAVIDGNRVLNTSQTFSLTARGIKVHNCFGGIVEDNQVIAYPAGFHFTSSEFTVYRDNTATRSLNKYWNEDSSADDGGGNQ